MRKNSVRKFIHAILDLLPLFVIPIFAININQKSVDPISIEVQEKVSVDFNQKRKDISSSPITRNGITYSFNNDYYSMSGTTSSSYSLLFNDDSSAKLFANHIYLLKANVLDNPNNLNLSLGSLNSSLYVSYNSNTQFTGIIDKQLKITNNINYNGYGIQSLINNTDYTGVNWTYSVFDLTQMYGEGNEPTNEEFNNLFPSVYYNYTESQKMLVNKPNPTTYDDTDIGSQFVYVTYNAVDKYFNMGNVFNMTGVYDWFVVNIFSGDAPISLFIVWNVALYEFVMDLLMLLYGLFMWFIDMIEKLMNKPLDSIK